MSNLILINMYGSTKECAFYEFLTKVLCSTMKSVQSASSY
jgi:hypothetical protein